MACLWYEGCHNSEPVFSTTGWYWVDREILRTSAEKMWFDHPGTYLTPVFILDQVHTLFTLITEYLINSEAQHPVTIWMTEERVLYRLPLGD